MQDQGADIEGAPGVGYLLHPGFMPPPLMFTEEELEALILGSRWVAARTDTHLAESAANALARIAAVLPTDLRDRLDANSLLVPRLTEVPLAGPELRRLREAIRTEIKVRISYTDAHGAVTERTIWPIAVAFFERANGIVAWCEERTDFRHFRLDRIGQMQLTAEHYPTPRRVLVRQWRKQLNLPQLPDRI